MGKRRRASVGKILSKVPEVTLAFWIVKILSTTVGETGADYLAVNIGWGFYYTTALTSALLLAVFVFQVRLDSYSPPLYWLTVVLVSVVGTQITDILTDKLDVSLYVSTFGFGVALAAIFAIWYSKERTLAMHSIVTRRRELFYWLAILFTFALGTAAGDLATEEFGLGFKIGVLVFSALIAIAAVAYKMGFNSIAIFWATYILTRPLGASLGDLLSQSKEYGGFGFGTVWTSILFLAVIIILVAALTVKENREPQLFHELQNS